jgi:hypothetical protein
MAEDCTGNYIIESKGCRDCYDIRQSEDCAYCQCIVSLKDSMDVIHFGGNTELIYESTNIGQEAYHCMFHAFGYGSKECLYCDNVHYSSHCFGCAGLHQKQYCILNKQYTKEAYEALVPRIIADMREQGAWGEFFPIALSPFAYNETTAQEHVPLTKETAEARGWRWREEGDEMPNVPKILRADQLPVSIRDVPDDILQCAIRCEATGRPFRIVKQELDFYRQWDLPNPHFHPDERHRRRMALRNPRKLWERSCGKCGNSIQTTYAPDRPEIVYCEECYLKEVY